MGKDDIRILIVDDHPLIREGLRHVFAPRLHLQIVGEAIDGREVLSLYKKTAPDVVLMDLAMPYMDGLTALGILRQTYPHACVIILSVSQDQSTIAQALQAGAKAFVCKSAHNSHLMEVLEQVAALTTGLVDPLFPKIVDLEVAALTVREQEILQYIADGHTNAEIGIALVISIGTVKTHVNNLIIKLQARNRTQAALMGVKQGLVHIK